MIADQNLTPLNPDEPKPGDVYPQVRNGKLLDERSQHCRAGWREMLRAIDRGTQIDREDFEANVLLAREFRDDPSRADRVRLGAIQFLDGLVARGLQAAMQFDKTEPQPVNVAVLVKVIEGVNEELL